MKKVTYVGHSGFLLEVDSCYMLFDYFQGIIPKLNPEKELLVFVSHSHYDHYNKAVLKLHNEYPHVRYILSDDISCNEYLGDVTHVSENRTYKINLHSGDAMQISTLKSTDEGVAFIIELSSERYYHAGDLNLWIWEGEPDPYNQDMEKAYFAELDKIRNMEFEIAFVPLDPRLEQNAELGMESFLEYTNAKIVFPMHCQEKYHIIDTFLEKKEHEKYKDQVVRIQKPGEVFVYEKESKNEI